MKFTNKDFLKLTIRSYFIRLFYNYKTLFGEGLCYCLLPYAQRRNKLLIKNKNEKQAKIEIKQMLQRHNGFFNSNEYLICLAIGIIMKMEEQQEYTELNRIKMVIKSTLGAIGDNLIYNIFKPLMIFPPIFIVLLFNFKVTPLMIFLLLTPYIIFNIFNFGVRFYGVKIGYKNGIKALYAFKGDKYKNNIKKIYITNILFVFAVQLIICYQFLSSSNQLLTLNHLTLKDLIIASLLCSLLLISRIKSRLDSVKFNIIIFIVLFILPTIYCFL